MQSQIISMTPRNIRKNLQSNINSFSLASSKTESNLNIGYLFSKLRIYMESMRDLLKQNKIPYGTSWTMKNFHKNSMKTYKFNSPEKPAIKQENKLENMGRDWISSMNRINNKLLAINADQKNFYEVTKDEYRSYLDINKGEIASETTANSGEERKMYGVTIQNPPHDTLNDSEAEYMRENSIHRAKRNMNNISKPKNRFKTFDRLFQRENPKTVTKFQKVSKIIKDFCRKEYDNRMFDEVFHAVSQPQTLELKKAEIYNLLESQNHKLKEKFDEENREKSKGSRQKERMEKNYLTTWNQNALKIKPQKSQRNTSCKSINRRFLQSARAERSRMNKIKVNAPLMYQKKLTQKRLQSARHKKKPILKKLTVNSLK